HENQPTPGLMQAPQGVDRRRIGMARERKRAVVVAGEGEIAHGSESIGERVTLRSHRPRLVKKFFTLWPKDRAPSLTCSHALFASGSAALPASFIRSPVVFAPSTTVLPTPLAVSLMPSPVVLAPLSTCRVASFNLDSLDASANTGVTVASAYTSAKAAAVLNVFMRHSSAQLFLSASMRSSVPGCVEKNPPPPDPSVCMSHVSVEIMTSFGWPTRWSRTTPC